MFLFVDEAGFAALGVCISSPNLEDNFLVQLNEFESRIKMMARREGARSKRVGYQGVLSPSKSSR